MKALSFQMPSLGLLAALVLSVATDAAAVPSGAAPVRHVEATSVMPAWWVDSVASSHRPGTQDPLDTRPASTWPGPDGFHYYGSACAYDWVEIAGTGTAVALSDDEWDGPFPIGFAFPFYDSHYAQFYLSSNGWLSFDRPLSSDLSNDCPLPHASVPNDIIALMWDDLDPGDTGDLVHYQTFTSCPLGAGACLVVQYENYHHFPGGEDIAGTFEALLYEGGAVVMQFKDAGVEEGAASTTGIEGDDAPADYGLTYACDTPGSLSDNLCIQYQRLPGLYLSPDTVQVEGCPGLAQTHTLHLANWTGVDGTFDLSYAVAEPAYGTLDGPASLFVANEMEASLAVTLTSELCLPDGFDLAATVTAVGSAYSDTAYITSTVATGGSWQWISDEPDGGRMDNVTAAYDGLVWSITGYGSNADVRTHDRSTGIWYPVPDSAPLFGVNHARSGCQVANRVYVYGDSVTPDFTGLWSYDMDANTWTNLAPTGTAPVQTAIWAPAWVYDPEDNLCYLTGGSESRGPGDLTTGYVYDPAANEWLPPLPSFQSPRGSHAAWMVGGGAGKMLCVAGGLGPGRAVLDSTQCFDFDAGIWNAENADLGMLPAGVAGMGYADKLHGGTDEQLWIVGGLEDGSASDQAIYYEVNSGAWRDGGSLANGAVWRTSATALNNEIYRLGGSVGGPSTYTGRADRHVQCPVCGQRGWLEGHVYDYDGVNVPCHDATVQVEPGDLELTLDPTGYYTVSLIPFEYQVSAIVPDYPEPDGPYPVAVQDGASAWQDFTLRRPDLALVPPSLDASAVAISTTSDFFTITNSGSYTLEYELREVPPPMVLDAMLRPPSQPGVEVEPELLAEMRSEGAGGYLIYFRERPDLSRAFGMDWQERGRFVVDALRRAAERSQADVRAYLDGHGVDYRVFWIDNVIVVDLSNEATFEGLMDFSEIKALRTRRNLILYEPEPEKEVKEGKEVASYGPLAAEPNISHVRADQVWAMGITGQGIVVANIDTGVRYTHEALVNQYRGNLGGGIFDHNHNWWDPASGDSDLVPNDFDGHGSHTMGTMLGDDGAGNQIGMAPGATWIACQGFQFSDDELLECGEFMAAPWDLTGAHPNPDLRPHVVSNSWGDCLRAADYWYDGVLESWHALGIYPVFSNGNSSNCGYASPPGCNTVGNPARARYVTGVGSTGQSDGQYATHSNWGPTDDPDTVNPRGYPNLKPQVMAPGVDVRSSVNGSDWAYGRYSGTSMSAPHVAGLIALMWQAAPCLVGDYATTETIIEQTATPIPYASECGGEGPGNAPNHATGWGEIDAVAAVQEAQDYCGTDWLPWVETDVVSGTLGVSGEQVVEVTFSCDITAAQQLQPLEGTLRLSHNDPCREPVDIDLTFSCAVEDPIPDWRKQIWINGDRASSVVAAHPIRPGDTVVIVDDVRVVFSETVTSVLTETWTHPLDMIGYDTSGIGKVMSETNTLVWELLDVAPNGSYPITKTFRVRRDDWLTGAITETFWVEDALFQEEAIVLEFHRAAGIYLPLVLRN